MTGERERSGPIAQLFRAAQRLLSRLAGLGETRLKLLALDIEEERARLAGVLFVGGLMLIFSACGLFLLILLLVTVFGPEHRLLVLSVLCALFLALAVLLGVALWRAARRGPRPFDATLTELERDRSALEEDS